MKVFYAGYLFFLLSGEPVVFFPPLRSVNLLRAPPNPLTKPAFSPPRASGLVARRLLRSLIRLFLLASLDILALRAFFVPPWCHSDQLQQVGAGRSVEKFALHEYI
jgi:hypothetical protein